MRDYMQIFSPEESTTSEQTQIQDVLNCYDAFGKYFNDEDLEGMDSCLHFPHYLVSGNEMLVWENKGQLPSCFFANLKKQGWGKTVVQSREVVLVSSNKVHLKVKYTRETSEGTILSKHDNVWIFTCKDNKWGILLRSY